MSRGTGAIQNAILKAVFEAETPPSFEAMRWSLYPAAKNKPVADSLPASWNTAFSRSLYGLADATKPQIRIERRPLKDLQECIRHYPSKTLNTMTRSIRSELLPDHSERRGV